MLLSMAYTQTDLDNVNTALATGEMSVSFSDRSVTYRSIDSLIKVKRLIEAELSAAAGSVRQSPRHQIARFADE